MALTDEAINRIRQLIQTGELRPGERLPPEQKLAAQLGMSRGSMREAVKALEAARVLDVRQGDGTYVTSLAPQLLLEGFGIAVALLRDHNLLEVMEVRRMLEPTATGSAALCITVEAIVELDELLVQMRASMNDAETMIAYDLAFHRTVIAANGSATLTSVLDGLSGQTLRARTWRGSHEGNAATRTINEHEAILDALKARDPMLAHAAALLHINTSEAWLRNVLSHV